MGAQEGGTDVRTDRQNIPCILQDIVFTGAAARKGGEKNEKEEKNKANRNNEEENESQEIKGN